uniref:PPM-type phosphatase domain-containing protein n=1 Tax=Heligmosomoides polygyrus TaxID=6339 RepID=A0A183FUJ4_HELPZ
LVEKQAYPYSRPEFLYFSEDEIMLSADQCVRPVLCPKYPSKMPLYAGYAEVINAVVEVRYVTLRLTGFCLLDDNPFHIWTVMRAISITYGNFLQSGSVAAPRAEAAFFAIFDGHAGSGAALVASRCLHEHIKARLGEVLESIIQLDRNETLLSGRLRSDSSYSISKVRHRYRPSPVCPSHSRIQMDSVSIRCDQLVIGALEAAFVDMDTQITEDKQTWRIAGGCAAIAVLVFLGKLYVANAGDCRAVLVTDNGAQALSSDFTPATERKRLQTLTKVLFRDWFMDGWAAKTVKECDLKPPLISESSRKKRLLNTIGVSRGFGDHHLFTVDDHLPIKPFLSSVPEVRVFDLRNLDTLSDKDVLIVASDGLWDVLTNEDAGLIVRSSLSGSEQTEQSRYTMTAQELAIAARGYPSGSNGHRWTMNSGGSASTDDITVIEDDDDDEMISLCGED